MVTLPDGEYGSIGSKRSTALALALSALIRPPRTLPPPGTPRAVPELPPLLALGAPRHVQLTPEPVLPALVAARRTGLRRWQVDVHQNLRVVAVNLSDGSVISRRLHDTHRRQPIPQPSMSNSPPDALNASAISVGVSPFPNLLAGSNNLRKPWPPGRYALTLIEYDWLSNTVVVEMTGNHAAITATAAMPLPVTRFDASPAGHEGIDFRLPPRAAPGAPQQVQVTLRLATAHTVLTSSQISAESRLVGSLLMLALDAEQVVRADVAIPVRTPAAGEPVHASFSFELQAALPGGLARGRYQCYLVLGDTVTGPRGLTVE